MAERDENGLTDWRNWSAPVSLARRIAHDIIESEVAVGAHLGSLPDVARRYDVSVPTLRKAITYLLEDGFVVAREGRGGGLVVAAPAAESAMQAMYLYFAPLSLTREQVREARDLINEALAERSCRLVDAPDLLRLEGLFAQAEDPAGDSAAILRAFDEALLATAKQPVLALVSRVLDRIESEQDDKPISVAEQLELRRQTSRAIFSARLGEVISLRRQMRPLPEPAENEAMRSGRLADRIVKALNELIRSRKLAPGDEIGRERDLQERLGVGRTTLRDALRPLERSGEIRVTKGRGGGIFVGSAEPYAAVDMTSLYLSSVQLTFLEQIESRHVLEARAAWLAAERITPDQRARLGQAMRANARSARFEQQDWNLHGADVERQIALACGNPLIEFFTLALIELSLVQARRQGFVMSLARAEFVRLVSVHHGEIVEAILAGQPALAAFNTRRYLRELGHWVR